MPEPEVPIERFEVFATGLDHPECLAFDRAGRRRGRLVEKLEHKKN